MKNKMRYNNDLPGRILILTIGVILAAFGTGLMMKAGLGQSTVSALARNVEYITGIKAGTIISIINYVCFGLQIIILRKEFKLIQVLQIALTTVFGAIINFFNYDFALTANIGSDIYLVQMSLVLLSIVITALGVGAMLKADLILLPYEGFCNAVVYKMKKPFAKVRPFIDGSFVMMALVLIFIFKIPNTTVREGTIIFMLSFGQVVGFYNNTIFSDNEKLINIPWRSAVSAK